MSLSTISLVLVVAIIVSLIKPFLELKVPPVNPLHDTSIRVAAIVVGILGAAFDYATHGGTWGDGVAIETLLGNGLVAGVGAVLTYHLLTSSVWDTLSPSAAVAAAKMDPLPAVVTTVQRAAVESAHAAALVDLPPKMTGEPFTPPPVT